MADILGLEWMRGPLSQVDFETICRQILEKKSTEIQEISLNYYWEKPITRMKNLSDIKKDVMLRPLRELQKKDFDFSSLYFSIRGDLMNFLELIHYVAERIGF